ncbi:hypothetical protein N656DRAFT_373134 [Canariomyces notabilis]|uniref:Uncharacterized protein n=1 Tax=Canariomyces notabilis TaxID=2074819 RepID=A0AAN6QEI3_9PEZI|nr:hypothetical protein N656DRAFT_373134 [Canariomyces arenarius]
MLRGLQQVSRSHPPTARPQMFPNRLFGVTPHAQIPNPTRLSHGAAPAPLPRSDEERLQPRILPPELFLHKSNAAPVPLSSSTTVSCAVEVMSA